MQNHIFIFSQSRLKMVIKILRRFLFLLDLWFEGGSQAFRRQACQSNDLHPCNAHGQCSRSYGGAFQNPTHDSFEGNASPHWLRQPLVEWTNKKRVNSFVWSEYETADYCEGSVVENVFVAPARWIIVISLWRFSLVNDRLVFHRAMPAGIHRG